MAYLPAYTIPAGCGAKKPPWWMYPAAAFLPVVFAIPVIVVVGLLHPVRIHFPQLAPGAEKARPDRSGF
jgi:hypothetical protein